jgi:hypothetical protein
VGAHWTTYELRHSFVSLVADQLDHLIKVADLVDWLFIVNASPRTSTPPG